MAVLTLAELVELQRLRAAANKNRSGNIHAYGAYSTAWYKHGGASLCIRIVLLVFATACTGAAQRVVRSAPRSDAAEVGAALLAFSRCVRKPGVGHVPRQLSLTTHASSSRARVPLNVFAARTPSRNASGGCSTRSDEVQRRDLLTCACDPRRSTSAQSTANAAIVTFHLRNDERVGRRTIVFRKTDGAWRIAHLHASNVPWPDEVR